MKVGFIKNICVYFKFYMIKIIRILMNGGNKQFWVFCKNTSQEEKMKCSVFIEKFKFYKD